MYIDVQYLMLPSRHIKFCNVCSDGRAGEAGRERGGRIGQRQVERAESTGGCTSRATGRVELADAWDGRAGL